jgi:hypothetical protein
MLIRSYNFDKTVFFIKFACHLPVGRQHAVFVLQPDGFCLIEALELVSKNIFLS